jgi:CheY-like chemotaxis protein
MPEMDGFDVVETLRTNEKTSQIPIIVVSAQELTAAEFAFLHDQVEVLLRKGVFTEQELLSDVQNILERIGKG